MPNRLFKITAAGVLAALALAAGLAYLHFQKRQHIEHEGRGDLVPAIVAHHALPAGTIIDWESISQKPVERALVTEDAVLPETAPRAVKQRLKIPLAKHEVLRWEHLEAVPD